MANKCDFCVDAPRGCNHICKGNLCNKFTSCHRKLSAIVRITTKCTQKCAHCCFGCSPDCSATMTVKMAKLINEFMLRHGMDYVNIMGGEFFCNSHWASIIRVLCNGMAAIRLTTNGDWGALPLVKLQLLPIIKKYPIIIAISKDRYHTNAHVEEAADFCTKNNLPYKIGKGEVNNDDAIVPVNRGIFYSGDMASLTRYCWSSPSLRYRIMIDEMGYIAKCPMGIWKYDNVKNYLSTDPVQFYSRFKFVSDCFHTTIACNDCSRTYTRIGAEFEKNCV